MFAKETTSGHCTIGLGGNMAKLKRMKSVEVQKDYKLKIIFTNGQSVNIDFKKKIMPDTIMAPLTDFELFKKVKISREGRVLEWPGEIDFCADSLWLEGSGEVNPFVKEKAS